MGIVSVKIYKSFGGRSSRGQWTNTYDILTDNAIGSPELDAEIDVIVGMEKTFHLTSTHFMRAVASTYEKEGRTGHPEAVRTRELAGTGSRAPAAGVDTLPLDVCLAVKASAVTGRSGTMKYRGALTENDVTGSGSGAFNYAPSSTEAQNAFSQFMSNAARPTLVIPLSTSASGTPAREIVELTESGVVINKKERRRKRVKKLKNDADAEFSINDIIDQGIDLLGLFVGKGAEIPIARKSFLVQLLGNAIDTLTQGKTKLELPAGTI